MHLELKVYSLLAKIFVSLQLGVHACVHPPHSGQTTNQRGRMESWVSPGRAISEQNPKSAAAERHSLQSLMLPRQEFYISHLRFLWSSPRAMLFGSSSLQSWSFRRAGNKFHSKRLCSCGGSGTDQLSLDSSGSLDI